jgi:hypothetical protein
MHDHGLENGHLLNRLHFSVYHDPDISPVKAGSMFQAQYIMLSECNISSWRHHSQQMSAWYTRCPDYIPDSGAGDTGWYGVTR